MSLKSVLHSIVAFVSHIWGVASAAEKKFIHAGVLVTEAIKNFDDNNPQIADFVTAMIPGTVDDAIKEKLREGLPKVLVQAKLVDESTTDAELLKNSAEAIKNLTGLDLKLKLDELAKRITDLVGNGKIPWSQLAYMVKYYYDHEFDKDEVVEAEPAI